MLDLPPPQALLFDWQNTLASTMDALYNAVDDTLTLLKPQHGLADNELGRYVKRHHRLPKEVRAEKKMSRTDLFRMIFVDENAREATSDTFNECYRNHFKDVHALDDAIEPMLKNFRKRGIKLGIVSNRARAFINHELAAMGWDKLFDTVIAAGDGCPKKPSPEPMLIALRHLGMKPGRHIWFMGDGKSDIQCGCAAGVATVFYNFAGWTMQELNEMFPVASEVRPDRIVQDFEEFQELVDGLR